jgi:PIN domain nuclease of toxin-antitoxin system
MTSLLLDSHALFWFIRGNTRPSPAAWEAIQNTDNVVYVSAVTAWEIASKFHLGKWPEARELVNNLAGIMSTLSFESLPLSIEHAHRAGALPHVHRDPFNRVLAAQAEIDDIAPVTVDPAFRHFSVRVLW